MTPEEIKAANDEVMRAYRICFSSASGQAVMSDLMRFCSFRKEANGKIEEGMRRVFLRIVNMTNLTDEQLYMMYAGRQTQGDDDND
jgi:hypothetical protein